MICLCEECFPDYGTHMVKLIFPLSPCEECDRFDNRRHGGLQVNLFGSDPRPKSVKDGIVVEM